MQIFSLILLSIFFATSFGFPSPCQAAKITHVIIDPGHGGIDSGASHTTNNAATKESTIVLQVAKKVAELLKNDSEFQVTMTRLTDKTVPLDDRTSFAHKQKGDMFVSIHVNSLPQDEENKTAHGAEFYFQNQLSADEEVLFLASKENENESNKPSTLPIRKAHPGTVGQILEDMVRNHDIRISAELVKDLRSTWKGKLSNRQNNIYQAPFRVLTGVQMPSVLIEIGYLTHKTEGPSLTDPQYQKQMAYSIYQGIRKFKEKLDKTQALP